MPKYSPAELAARIKDLRLAEPHVLLDEIDGPLTPAHAAALLQMARGLAEWHKIVATLIIGDFFFDDEFVDFAIDMLTFARGSEDWRDEPLRGEDPLAVGLHATNLLSTRRSVTRAQYDRIMQLPESTPGRSTLISTLGSRVAPEI
jgi:hypothetical protein